MKVLSSSAMDRPAGQPLDSGDDSELLVREARRRQHRRWLAIGGALIAVVAGVGLGLALSAGGDTAAPQAKPPKQTAGSPAGAGVSPCSPSDLKVAVGFVQGTGGQWYIPLQFTDVAGGRCAVSGYPDVSLVGVGGQAVGGSLPSLQGGSAHGRVVLENGQIAAADLTVPNAAAVTDANEACEQVTFSAIKVSAPASGVVAGSSGEWATASTTCLSGGGGTPAIGPLHAER